MWRVLTQTVVVAVEYCYIKFHGILKPMEVYPSQWIYELVVESPWRKILRQGFFGFERWFSTSKTHCNQSFSKFLYRRRCYRECYFLGLW